jgi:hypothetical protein
MSTITAVGIGSAPNDGLGDPARTGASKINTNFTNLNAGKAEISQQLSGGTLHKVYERKNSAGTVVYSVYVDEATGEFQAFTASGQIYTIVGTTMTILTGGKLVLIDAPAADTHAVNRKYVTDNYSWALSEKDKLQSEKYAKLTVTDAEIKSLFSSPYTLIYCDASEMIIIDKIVTKLTFASSAFDTTGNDLSIETKDTGTAILSIPETFVGSSESAGIILKNPTESLGYLGEDIMLTCAADPTNGDSEMQLEIYYHSITF